MLGETQAPQQYKDCVSCRIIGTAALAGVGSYALVQSRHTAPGSLAHKRVMGGVGVVFLIGSVIRWFQ